MKKPSLVRVAVAVGIVIVLAVALRLTVFSFFVMEGNSMAETIQDRDFLFVNKLDTVPERGDVVVFRAPFSEDGDLFLKRVIGVPGDTVLLREGKVFIESEGGAEELDEPYLDERNTGRTFNDVPRTGDDSERRFLVPDDGYFVLGDNRQGSFDSRGFNNGAGIAAPFVPAADIVGTVWFR